MLDPRFPPYTPGSRRLYDFEDAGDQAQLSAEVRRTLDAIAAAAPARTAKGQLTEAEAKRAAALWLAIAEDLEAQDQWLLERNRAVVAWTLADKLAWLGRNSGVTWRQKVAELRREIEARRAGYPAQVAKGQLTADQAKLQLEQLEAAHDLYWRHGFAFDEDRAELRKISDQILDADLEREKEAAA